MWQFARKISNNIDLLISYLIIKFRSIDYAKIFLTFMWLISVIRHYCVKIYEFIFKWYINTTLLQAKSNFNPPGIKILLVSDGNLDITDKFKLFLSCYYDKNNNWFLMSDYSRFFNSNDLQCTYILWQPPIKHFWKNMYNFTISVRDKDVLLTDDKMNTEILPFGMVRFKIQDIEMDELEENTDKVKKLIAQFENISST